MMTVDSNLDKLAGHGHHDEGSYLTPKYGPIATVWDWMTTVDHKKNGVMDLFAVLFMFFLGGAAAIVLRVELLEPTRIVDGELTGAALSFLAEGGADAATMNSAGKAYNQIMTMHGAVMVFMFIIPGIPASLGNFFLPLMLGAKDVAFPRLNLASWYI
ncbi:MAG: cbb3-type cytochrome c oxidase subunit I, partial [Draconibacterium sp.]|nr:cbb3-type cytochrome c oxidase subunit I [Draconibacterium sp.]